MPALILFPNATNTAHFLADIRDVLHEIDPAVTLGPGWIWWIEGFTALAKLAQANPLERGIEESATLILAGILEWLAVLAEANPGLASPTAHSPTNDDFLTLCSGGMLSADDYTHMIHHLVGCRSCCRCLANHVRNRKWKVPSAPGTCRLVQN